MEYYAAEYKNGKLRLSQAAGLVPFGTRINLSSPHSCHLTLCLLQLLVSLLLIESWFMACSVCTQELRVFWSCCKSQISSPWAALGSQAGTEIRFLVLFTELGPYFACCNRRLKLLFVCGLVGVSVFPCVISPSKRWCRYFGKLHLVSVLWMDGLTSEVFGLLNSFNSLWRQSPVV